MDEKREEAIRAKTLAQTKMEKKDFSSALGLAVKAQQLYPDLEAISHIILVCDVLCSAKKKVKGNENDWYAILKVEATADEATIRKQYRKFALNLHPDKNKFTGASEAFGLISEAQNVLLDRNKRLLYDMKLQTAGSNVRRENFGAYSHSNVKRQPPYQNSGLNKFASKDNNPQQQQKSESVNDGSTFWTTCPHCLSMFMYYRNILERRVVCQKCKMTFSALENKRFTSPIILGEKNSMQREETGIGHPKHSSESVPKKVYSKVELKKDVSDKKSSESRKGFTTDTVVAASRPKREYSNMESISNRPLDIDKSGSRIRNKRKFTAPGNVYSKVELQIDGDKKHSRVKDGVASISGEFFKPKDGNTNEEATIQESNNLSESNSRINKKRKRKKNPKYEENQIPGNGDRVIEKKPASSESCKTVSGQPRECVPCDTYIRRNDVSGTPEKQVNMESVNNNAGLPANTEENQMKIVVRNRSLSKEVSQHGEKDAQKNSHFEFRIFDDLRNKAIFENGQIWAVYDTLDAMPRFYAIISKVSCPDFKVDLRWLEPDPDHEEEIKWIEAGLPVSCGKFRCGYSDTITDTAMFSHLVYWEKSSREGTYEVHPRRGETWALFKDWDINWYACSETKKKYEYEYVEVLSDYSSAEGVYVAFLTNLGGFSCTSGIDKKGSSSVLIPAKEKFRFSHEVPSFKTTEKVGSKLVNISFELDPASLPTHEHGTVFSAGSVLVDKELHPSSLYSQSSVDLAVNMKENPDGFAVKEDIESIRKLDIPDGGLHEEGEQKVGSFLRNMVERHAESIENQNLTSNLQSDMEATHISSIAHKMQVNTKSACNATLTQGATSSESKFYNFDQDKSPDKFQTGQIWAIYRNAATAPKYYGKIKQIDPFPAFKIHVTWLQSCSPPEGKSNSVSKEITIACGKFKIKPGRASLYTDTDLFSHQVNTELSDTKNVYVIFPKKGEIWAMYQDCKHGLNDYKCEIVEVMEENDIFLTVLILEPVGGYKSVFRPRVEGKPNGAVQIYKTELSRFSHQIPAYRLTEEKGGPLHGLWELNAAALQNYLFIT